MLDYKIILYGDFGVGKTSLTTRLLRKQFCTGNSPTIGGSFMSWKPDTVDQITLGIWDTAGQERFSRLVPMYLRNSDAVFYCWDITVPFDASIADGKYLLAKEHSPSCHFYVVFTKLDLRDPLYSQDDAVSAWAKDHPIEGCFYTSAMTGLGVQELFTTTAQNLLAVKRVSVDDTLNIGSGKLKKRVAGIVSLILDCK